MRDIICIGMIVCGTVANVHAGDPTVEGILADWKARQGKFKTAKYVMSGTTQRLDMPGSIPYPISFVVLIDVEGKRLRIEKAYSGKDVNGNAIQRKTLTAFDGKVLNSYTPRDINGIQSTEPNIFKAKGNLTISAYTGLVWPILEAHGIVPTATRIPRPDKLPLDHECDTFNLRGKVTHEGRNCLSLRTEPLNHGTAIFDDIYMDPLRASAIVRHTYMSGKNPFFRIDATFSEVAGLWMPNGCSYTQYEGEKVSSKINLKVDIREFDIPMSDTDFSFTPMPGDTVREDTFPEPGQGLSTSLPAMKTSDVQANGQLAIVSETGYVTGIGEQLPPEESYKDWRWLVLLPLVSVGGLFVRDWVKKTYRRD